MELNKYIVTPEIFEPQNWINYFETCSDAFIEKHESLHKYADKAFPSVSSLGSLSFDDATNCGLYLLQIAGELTPRSSRKRQFEKATQMIKQEYKQAGIFIFYDELKNFRFSLVYPVYKGTKRTFSNFRRHSFYVGKGLPNKTYHLQLSKHMLNSMNELKDVFSVERVSAIFYQEFESEYSRLQKGIKEMYGKDVDDEMLGNFALLFVIRIIFLGFVQKKGWLGDSQNFIREYLDSYDPTLHQQGIYQDLLSPLFFKALNSAPSQKHKHGFPRIPEPFNKHLVTAPYLNGGLFRKHELYDTNALMITDEAIQSFVNFLFSFNFTLEENTLYDEELELNPEFLGIIFEKLINKAHGAIYTPRLEVDFMCRLALIKYLQNNLQPDLNLENLYKLFFPEYSSDGAKNPGDFTETEAEALLEKLESVSVCDPAIGSGAFAVGMLNVIDEIECSIYKHFLPKHSINSPYERKKRIIFQSLYGVEVKQWAVWITQLRLWITLLIEAEDNSKHSEEPLLPSFDFKIRQGDSLIQMMGNTLIPTSGEGAISGDITRKLKELTQLKAGYYQNKCPVQLQEIEKKHKALHLSILERKRKDLAEKIFRIENFSKAEAQDNVFGTNIQAEIELISQKQKMEIEQLEYQKLQTVNEMNQISAKNLPFIWRIDFPEVFIQKGGFDIVIGNPPYVAQEEIEDPLGNIKDNKKYKELLKQMANQDFPQDIPQNTISGKSDLYTYFYIRGLKLLNKKGVLSFICSNSWLDVEFGAWLQKFLLERCQIHFIIDNLSKRVFREAGINTIISFIGARQNRVRADDLIRFAAFKLPFENSLYTENLLAIEEATERIDFDDLRINPINREKLSQEGWDNSKNNKYKGSKWGGIYIKAPDIYFTIMEKAKGKMVKLGDIAKVTRGFTTGADDFFYIPKSNPYHIEPEFLAPVIKSPKECKSILIDPDELNLWLFMCPFERHELKGTNALKYIEMGEKAKKYIKQGKDKGKYIVGLQNVSTINNRNPWWSLNQDLIASIFVQMTFSETFKFFFSKEPIYGNNRLYCIDSEFKNLQFLLNSSLSFLLIELIGRSNLGDGALDLKTYEAEKILVTNPELFSAFDFSNIADFLKRPIKPIFQELQVDPETDSFMNANPLADRKALDEVVFKALGLNHQEIRALYAGLLKLTSNRLKKAKTFTN